MEGWRSCFWCNEWNAQGISEVWNDGRNWELARSYLLLHGADLLLTDECGITGREFSGGTAIAIAILECCDPVQTKSLQDIDLSDNSKGWMKVQDATEGCGRSLLRFYSNCVPCSCLDKKYKTLTSQTKTGICVHWEQRKQMSRLMVCTGCERYQYCSR